MRPKRDPLVLAAAVTVVAMLLAVSDLPLGPVRVAVGMPLVVALPGYALLRAIFLYPPFGRAAWLVSSMATSLALVALSGFVLDWTPWGLQSATWAIWLGSITLAALAVAWYRRAGAARATQQDDGAVVAPAALPPVQLSRRQYVVIGAAATVSVAAFAVAYIGYRAAPTPGFTQFWLLPVDAVRVRLGMRNEEGVPSSFTLRLQADGELVREWAMVPLAPGETWEMLVTLPPERVRAKTIEALLYRARVQGYVYRRAVLQR